MRKEREVDSVGVVLSIEYEGPCDPLGRPVVPDGLGRLCLGTMPSGAPAKDATLEAAYELQVKLRKQIEVLDTVKADQEAMNSAAAVSEHTSGASTQRLHLDRAHPSRRLTARARTGAERSDLR